MQPRSPGRTDQVRMTRISVEGQSQPILWPLRVQHLQSAVSIQHTRYAASICCASAVPCTLVRHPDDAEAGGTPSWLRHLCYRHQTPACTRLLHSSLHIAHCRHGGSRPFATNYPAGLCCHMAFYRHNHRFVWHEGILTPSPAAECTRLG